MSDSDNEYYHPLYGKTITAGGLVSNFYVPTCVYKTDSEVNSYVY